MNYTSKELTNKRFAHKRGSFYYKCIVLAYSETYSIKYEYILLHHFMAMGRATSSTNISYDPPPTDFYYNNKQTHDNGKLRDII